MEKLKECRRCFGLKPKSEFCKASRLKDGLQAWCKQCLKEYKAEWRMRARSPESRAAREAARKLRDENRKLAKDDLKRCNCCMEAKPLDEFHFDGVGGKLATCVACRREARNEKHVYQTPTKERQRQLTACTAVWRAINSGHIKKPTECKHCHRTPRYRKRSRIEFHHTNGYDKEHRYVGIFVCSWCHAAIHQGKITVEGKNHYSRT